MTKSSADASGPSGARSMPGAFMIVRASSPPMPLVISVSDPDLRIMTRRASPFSLIAARKPSAIDSTDVKTITTPATPMTATADDPSRCEIDLRVTTVTARICESAFIVVCPVYARRSAVTIFSRCAWSAGRSPVPSPRITIRTAPKTRSRTGR